MQEIKEELYVKAIPETHGEFYGRLGFDVKFTDRQHKLGYKLLYLEKRSVWKSIEEFEELNKLRKELNIYSTDEIISDLEEHFHNYHKIILNDLCVEMREGSQRTFELREVAEMVENFTKILKETERKLKNNGID